MTHNYVTMTNVWLGVTSYNSLWQLCNITLNSNSKFSNKKKENKKQIEKKNKIC